MNSENDLKEIERLKGEILDIEDSLKNGQDGSALQNLANNCMEKARDRFKQKILSICERYKDVEIKREWVGEGNIRVLQLSEESKAIEEIKKIGEGLKCEFNLSEKLERETFRDDDWWNENIWEDDLDLDEIVELILNEVKKDVKEFIRLLKEKIDPCFDDREDLSDNEVFDLIKKEIDKLAGDKLIELKGGESQ